MERIKMKKVKGTLTDEEKADRDDRRSAVSLRHTVINSGVKGLAVLNSAGVAAMLGFFQAIAAKPVLATFKPYGVTSLSSFLIGVIAAALLFIPYGTYIQERNKKYRRITLYACFFLGAFSVGCVIFGATMLVWGIDKSF